MMVGLIKSVFFGAAIALLYYALRTRQQWYLAIVYLSSSKWAYIILGNALVALLISLFRLFTGFFLDGLRLAEAEGLGDFFRWNITETCLALTMFRSELNSSYCIQAGKNDIPRGGNALRLSWCDSSKSSQKFVYHPEVGIRPLVNQTLCVVWKGITPTIVDQIDPIIINQCLNVSGRLGWRYDVEVS